MVSGTASSDISSTGHCFYSKLDGVLNKTLLTTSPARAKKSTARSKLECVIQSCDCRWRCIASFHARTGVCLAASISRLPLDWMKQCGLLTSDDDNSWSTYISREALTTNASVGRPSGLWLLDNLFRGCNLGSKGRSLDFSETNVTWNVAGPSGIVGPEKFARLSAASRPKIVTYQGGQFLLDFSQRFTMLVWVKTDDVVQEMPIIQGDAGNNSVLVFWFYPSKNQDQIYLFHKATYYSDIIAQGRLHWRHLSVRKDGDTYAIFVNGSSYRFPYREEGTNGSPEVLGLGFAPQSSRRHHASSFYQGSMACVAIFERALSSGEIKSFMDFCP